MTGERRPVVSPTIDSVDFYLVDLRGAKYDTDQAAHFRRCGAILESRVR